MLSTSRIIYIGHELLVGEMPKLNDLVDIIIHCLLNTFIIHTTKYTRRGSI